MPNSNLTLIRVRGKRHKTSISAVEDVARKARIANRNKSCSSRPSKNPVKHKHSDKIRLRDGSRAKMVAGKRVGHLEALPVELIEKIFLHSLEFNFARVSPAFGALLSRMRVFRILTFLAFYNDPRPDDGRSAAYISNFLRPLEYVPLGPNAQKALQAEVINCPWFNLSLLKQCHRDVFHVTLQNFVFGDSTCSFGLVLDNPDFDLLTKHLDKNPEDWGAYFKGKDRHGESCHLKIQVHRVGVMSNVLWAPDFLPMVVWTVPDEFFAEKPWTEDKFCLLHSLLLYAPHDFLLSAPNYLRPNTTIDISRDKIQGCIHHAITLENVRLLSMLLSWDERAHRYSSVLSPSTQNTQNPESYGTPGERYGIPGEHFVTATRQSEHPGLFQVLLRANAESIPYDDLEITSWAMRQGDRAFGDWLLNYMIDVPARRRDNSSLFSGGWATRFARHSEDFPDDPDCYIWWDAFEKYVEGHVAGLEVPELGMR
ncbi:uncharacterized protein PADG_04728 [Paracoccidioides brasiliensis Pb18]|uniref:Uncharacterized protein n=1 Tax=Paracoccidioides brasiliensis (strain Pb18) TaxID=502780 RepID=C1GCK6_PARBD|nr:uncharacterized protein PADG_04728 [Paracoccidioides brasiliensis Pb18]EEH48649.1 hypothetical protein PADG_04728 [Paracoccidioides brasiliensis Pb18]